MASTLILFSFSLIFFHSAALDIGFGGITIGGGDGSTPSPPRAQAPADCAPPPPPPPCPPPPSPPPQSPSPPPPIGPTLRAPNERLERDLNVIQRFKALIQKNAAKNDPKNITSSWRGNNPCNYQGFNCNPNPYHNNILTLSDVLFNGFNFGVKLSGFIDQLLDVSLFHANSNRFYGTVPPIPATKLPFLFELDLSNNKLEGSFPTQVLQSTNLTFLDLRFNTFQGTVPPSVFLLDVDVLFINNNNFSQNLPTQLGSTPALYLTFANNRFTGPIPSSIGLAHKTLIEVLFLNNLLTGCLPWQIGLLSLARVFDASHNKLHGPIPSSFACLDKMEILNFKGNCLDGVVPEMLCALPKLTNLTLSYNFFTEVGPRCRALIEKKVLHIEKNCILGLENQKPPEECARFFQTHPPGTCPTTDQYAPCKAAKYGNGDGVTVTDRRRAAELAGPVWSPTYGALNPL